MSANKKKHPTYKSWTHLFQTGGEPPEMETPTKESSFIRFPITNDKIKRFNQSQERGKSDLEKIMGTSGEEILWEYSKICKKAKSLAQETMEALCEIGLISKLDYLSAKSCSKERVILYYLYSILKRYSAKREKVTEEELSSLLIEEWAKVKRIFFNQGEEVPIHFVNQFRGACSEALRFTFPEIETYVDCIGSKLSSQSN